MGGCRGKLGRPRCRPRWDTHLNSRSLLNWNSSLAARAAGSVKKCTNGQTKTIWLPFSGSHYKSNPEKIWKTIYKLSNIKRHTRIIPLKLKKETNYDEITDTQDIINYLNNFFVTIGPKMAENISATKSPAPSKPTFSSAHQSLQLRWPSGTERLSLEL